MIPLHAGLPLAEVLIVMEREWRPPRLTRDEIEVALEKGRLLAAETLERCRRDARRSLVDLDRLVLR